MSSGDVNIQTLFAQLRLEQMLVYLPATGWYDSEENHPERIRLHCPSGDDGDTPFVLFLPRTNKAPQARRMFQAAIYTLCEVEDRQPAEIIRDILAVKIAPVTPKSIASKPGELRLRLINDFSEPLVLQIAERPGGCLLMPGEAFECIAHPPEGGSLDIRIGIPPELRSEL